MTQRNIYIFPSNQGLAFAVMLGVMLLTAINYQSSLIYLLVFMLGSIFVVSIWLCFFNMQGMRIRVKECRPVEAGSNWTLVLEADKGGKERSGFYAMLETSEESELWPVEKQAERTLAGTAHARGVYELPAVRVETFFPFGLIRAWTWLWFEQPLIVYPRPEPAPETAESEKESDSAQQLHEGDELSEVRDYREGDSLNRILWRHYARREELVIRSPELIGKQKSILDWAAYSSYGLEAALSYMCHDVLSLYRDNVEFSMQLPGVSVPNGAGDLHRDRCLEALARYQGV